LNGGAKEPTLTLDLLCQFTPPTLLLCLFIVLIF
jgi:hypothetical protein